MSDFRYGKESYDPRHYSFVRNSGARRWDFSDKRWLLPRDPQRIAAGYCVLCVCIVVGIIVALAAGWVQ